MVLFLAGHGINEASQYFFLPHDADPTRRSRTFLSQSLIYDLLRALPRKVLLFLDTCRAGSFANDLAYNAQVLVFSATATRQLSQESPAWNNGVFTEVLIEALTTAHREQRQLTTTDLDKQLYETVSAMTAQAQTPTVAKAGLQDIVLVPGNR